jgi:hypothetical protein
VIQCILHGMVPLYRTHLASHPQDPVEDVVVMAITGTGTTSSIQLGDIIIVVTVTNHDYYVQRSLSINDHITSLIHIWGTCGSIHYSV